MSAQSTLSSRMIALANTDAVNAEKLRAMASDLDIKTKKWMTDGGIESMKSFLGSWARARLFLKEITGEPLV